MTADQQRPATSWFERNPKKTLGLVLFLLLLGLTFAAEKILAYINRSHHLVLFTERRYINLRECLPGIDVVEVPPAKALRESDDLVRQEYRIRTDADGFVLPYHKYEKPDKTLVFLGGSTVLCLYVEEENRFPYLVGNLLERETGKKITSLNGGVGGNNTLHSLNLLVNKVIPRRPDLVILMHNINDLACLMYDKTYWSQNPSRSPIVEFTFYKNLKGLQALATLARDIYIPNLHVATRTLRKKILGAFKDPDDEFAHARGRRLELDSEAMAAEFRLNLQTFINICRARGITPVLMTQFNRYRANPDGKVKEALEKFEKDTGVPAQEFVAAYQRLNQATLEVARAKGVLAIDLARDIPQEKQYMYDVVHLNTAGSRLAARLISEKLRPLVAGSGVGSLSP
jgi:lysophospholipase L1-like esterase